MNSVRSSYPLSQLGEIDNSFICDFESIVFKLRQNIIVYDITDIKGFISKEFVQQYNYIHIIEVDLYTGYERANDCIDQISKSIKDSLSENKKINQLFYELLQPNLKEIHIDEIFDEIFSELMLTKEHVIFIIENFNYKAQFISNNDYHRLTKLCAKKYPNKLSFILVLNNMQINYHKTYETHSFLTTFDLNSIPNMSSIRSNKIMYEPLKDTIMITQEIYISYAWTNESGEVLKNLCKVLDDNSIKYCVDKKDIDYKGNIREFEEKLGKGNYIILIISDKFLKSKDCMYEILQINQNKGDISDKIFPIVLPDARIYDPEDRIDYIRYWENKTNSLNGKLKTIGSENLSGLRDEIDNYSAYRVIIDKIMTILKEMNTLSPEIHRDEKFKQLITSLKSQVTKDIDSQQKIEQTESNRSVNQYGQKSIYIEKNEGNITIK